MSAGYLQTMGIRLLQGRWLNEEDMNDSSDAAIVSDAVAKRLWPGESPIGKPVCVFCSPENPKNWKRVVGVVSSSRHRSMEGPQQQATVYLSAGALHKAVFLVVRSYRPEIDIQKAVRQTIASIDPNQPIFLSATMQSLIDDSLADRRFIMLLLALNRVPCPCYGCRRRLWGGDVCYLASDTGNRDSHCAGSHAWQCRSNDISSGLCHCDHWADFGARNHAGFNEDSAWDAPRSRSGKLR